MASRWRFTATSRHLPVNSKDAAGGVGVTQFGRALLALNIDIIFANSPQAKGRIALRQAQGRV
jgi:hypothetical protein